MALPKQTQRMRLPGHRQRRRLQAPQWAWNMVTPIRAEETMAELDEFPLAIGDHRLTCYYEQGFFDGTRWRKSAER